MNFYLYYSLRSKDKKNYHRFKINKDYFILAAIFLYYSLRSQDKKIEKKLYDCLYYLI